MATNESCPQCGGQLRREIDPADELEHLFCDRCLGFVKEGVLKPLPGVLSIFTPLLNRDQKQK